MRKGKPPSPVTCMIEPIAIEPIVIYDDDDLDHDDNGDHRDVDHGDDHGDEHDDDDHADHVQHTHRAYPWSIFTEHVP